MMNVIIIEDEKIAADNLERMLLSIDAGIHVLSKIESVRNAVKWLLSNTCDLIFLDIQLSDGNSFCIFEQVEVKTPVIFITAYDQFAIKAFKLNSIDYLLKPLNKEDLSKSLKKYHELNQNSLLPDFKVLFESIKKSAHYQERLLVNAGQKLKSVKTSEIAYFYVTEKGVFFCTKENKHYDIDYTLEKLKEILDPEYFFRINRRFIVHIDSIENMLTVSKSRLKLDIRPKPDEEVIVSVNNMHDFRLWLNR
jgi:two-component system, LytTR family, response regulator LytT